MLLQRLVEYAQRSPDVPPAMYNAEPVSYWIELDGGGQLLGIVPAESEDAKRPKRVPVPTLVRTSAITPKLLADNAEYTLGIGREAAKPERVAESHRAYVELVRRCATTTREPGVGAVLAFLERLDAEEISLPQGFDPSGIIGFQVDGARPTELSAVQEFWRGAAAEGPPMECLVCGAVKPAMGRLQLKLKGVPGGQTSGLALISANAPAFESYGLEASYTAPTCQDCSDLFMKGANQLIRGENTHLRLGAAVYIFWDREARGFPFMRMVTAPEPSHVRELLRSVFQRGMAPLDPTPFYAAALTASGARAVVRDWIDTTVGHAQQQLARYFELQQIVGWDGEVEPEGVYFLGRATVRTGSRDDPDPWVFTALMRCALAGGPLPTSLLFKAVERCRIERGVNHARAALMKMVLLSRDTDEDTTGGTRMTVLDPNNRSPAYLCGRLFAELEAVQRGALGKVGATIVDRYYGTASSAPATVFGRLVRGAQPHLGKLRRERPAAYHALDRRLGEIMEGLESFPATLSLEEQALFALGYYHQRAADHRSARARDPGARGVPANNIVSDDDIDAEEEERWN